LPGQKVECPKIEDAQVFPRTFKKRLSQKPAPKTEDEDAPALAPMDALQNIWEEEEKDAVHGKDIAIGRLLKKEESEQPHLERPLDDEIERSINGSELTAEEDHNDKDCKKKHFSEIDSSGSMPGPFPDST
jgi:hypothetical protein